MLCVTFALIWWRWNRGEGLPKKGKSYFHFWPRAQFCPWPGERPGWRWGPSDGQRRQSEEKRKLLTTFLISHGMFFREDKKAKNYLFLLFCRWPRRLVRRQPCLNQFSQSQSVWSADLILQEICCWKVVPGRLYCFLAILCYCWQ